MSSLPEVLWLIPTLPLLAAALIAFLGPTLLRERSHWPCITAIAVACVLSFFVLGAVQGLIIQEGLPEIARYYTWFHAGNVDVGFSLRADPLSAIMLVTITFVGSLIAIFSVGYMHGDEGYPRFFAEISLFIFAMTLLVLADHFVLLYAG